MWSDVQGTWLGVLLVPFFGRGLLPCSSARAAGEGGWVALGEALADALELLVECAGDREGGMAAVIRWVGA